MGNRNGLAVDGTVKYDTGKDEREAAPALSANLGECATRATTRKHSSRD